MYCATIDRELSGRVRSRDEQEYFIAVVGKSTCFAHPINGFAKINVHVAVMHDVHQIVLVGDFLWDQIDRDAYILVIFDHKTVPPESNFYVHSHETGSWCGDCVVQ